MSKEQIRIFPAPPPPAEIFATHQLAHEFRREAEYRQEFKEYCQWYRQTALQHQQEVAAMRNDINIFGWLVGGRSKQSLPPAN